MADSNILKVAAPALPFSDELGEVLKTGAQALLKAAIEAEVSDLLERYAAVQVDGKQAVVRNGYLPERTVQTGLGDIPVKVPKVRDRSGQGVKFNSRLVPPYLKRTRAMEEFIPWLYLKGISTGDMQPALATILGDDAKGLSPTTVGRLKAGWEADYDAWRKRDLSQRRFVYIWADGVHCNVRMDDRLCLLVIIGSDETGRKEVLAVHDGYRESADSWTEVLQQLTHQGLTCAPELAVGDGALGFWTALAKQWPSIHHQRCWVHKTANVLNKLPRTVQPRVKQALRDIWMAPTRVDAEQALASCVAQFGDKYGKAMDCLVKDREDLLAFYDYPAAHWQHLRTTNPIESVFATVRLRTDKVKNCGSRKTTLTMAWQLMTTAQQRWRRLQGYKLLADVIEGVVFKDGERVEKEGQQQAAA